MATLPQKTLLDVLVHRHKDLVVFMRNNFEDIALFLRQKDIIDHRMYNEMMDDRSHDSKEAKAEKLLLALENEVEEDGRYFYNFVQILNQNYSDSKITSQIKSAMEIHHLAVGEKILEERDTKLPIRITSEDKLMSDSNKMIIEFRRICSNLSMHIEKTNTNVEKLKDILQGYILCKTINKRNCHRCITSDDINNEKDVNKLLGLITSFSSFFNFKLVEDLINRIEYKEGKELLEQYKMKFKEYIRGRLTELPNGIAKDKECNVRFKVQLDDKFFECRKEHLLTLQADICEILHIESRFLQIDGIEPGSIWVIFLLLKSLSLIIFPLKPDQIVSLRKLQYKGAEIQMIICDDICQLSDLTRYEYEYAYKHFIDSKDVLELLSLKLMFLGPPRQGKNTTRRRVMKEIVDLQSAEEAEQVHGSTGTVECCPSMLVQDSSDSASPQSGAHWTIVQNLIEEASLLFHSLKDSLEYESVPQAATNSLVGSKTIAQVSEASSTEQPRTVQNSPPPKLPQMMMTKEKESQIKSKQSTPEHLPPLSPVHAELVPDSVTSSDYSEIAAIFNEVSQQPQFQQDVNHSVKAFLRMEDTGGQPELMDMLPALTIGPGLYLLFFSYEFNLDEEYRVFYQRDSGETTASEKSEFTLKDMLLCTLASISCSTDSRSFQVLENTDTADMGKILESSKSVVYLVGTHKDKVSEEYIHTMDEQLQKIITDTDFYKKGIIQFCSEEKLVVSLDNMTGGVKEVDELRRLLEKSMEEHFQKLKIPAVWLLFSLCLRMRDLRTASMEACLALASAFNMSPYETKTALWFLHHHAGVLMYFPNVSGLEDLVIIDIQVVYDSITQVILKAMSFDNVGRAAAERFKKTGIFTLIHLISAMTCNSEDIIPPLKLVALLLHLHIIAQVLSNTSVTESLTDKSEYIMPCVLEYTTSKEIELFHKEACHSSLVFPLFLYFTCGFTPMGLFPAMVSCLISNKSFTLIWDGIKKNMVQLIFEPNLKVTFMSRSKSYEVIVSCPLSIQDILHKECRSLKSVIEKTLEQASSRMNYSSYMDYQFGFECSSHEGGGHLGVVDRAVLEPKVMKCLFDPNSPDLKDLHNRHLIWYGQEYKKSLLEDSKGVNSFSVFLSLYPDLMNSVKPCVLELADRCFSVGLISEDIYLQIIARKDWRDTDQARCLLDSIRKELSAKPQALNQFVSVLSEVEDCKFVAQKLQHQLQ